ncbi:MULTISPECIES: hypothetical protein [unclassified Mesorhizobium]|nr:MULTISPECIES: hypothetical protein [unclassified Mesorhizobium]
MTGAVDRRKFGESVMEKSIGQARWLLAPVFAMAITLLAIGVALG